MLSYKNIKQTSENVADTTFKYTNRRNILKDKYKMEDLKRELDLLENQDRLPNVAYHLF